MRTYSGSPFYLADEIKPMFASILISLLVEPLPADGRTVVERETYLSLDVAHRNGAKPANA